jgi:hypothetical protein
VGADQDAALISGAVRIEPSTGTTLESRWIETVAALRQRIGDSAFDALATRGAALDDDQIVNLIRRNAEPRFLENDEEHLTAALLCDGNNFWREGDTWLLTYEDRSCRLRDAKGLHYLAALLAQPGKEIHVFDLVGGGVTGGGTMEPLDAKAKAEYRRRLVDLESEQAEATEWGDPERADRAQLEAEVLRNELAAAYGLGGRPRGGADPVERARKAVANRIRDSLVRIEAAHPSLGRHLGNSVRTGTFCSYQPERPTIWMVDSGTT